MGAAENSSITHDLDFEVMVVAVPDVEFHLSEYNSDNNTAKMQLSSKMILNADEKDPIPKCKFNTYMVVKNDSNSKKSFFSATVSLLLKIDFAEDGPITIDMLKEAINSSEKIKNKLRSATSNTFVNVFSNLTFKATGSPVTLDRHQIEENMFS